MKVILLLIIAFAAGVLAYGYSMMRNGFSARTQPTQTEIYLARKMREAAIPTDAKNEQNPWKASPDVIAAGRAHWADHCATCHANDGSGNTIVGQNLYPKAPDMRLAATQDLTDGEAERFGVDQDDAGAQPADDLREPGVIGLAAARHPQVGGGGQPRGKRFCDHPVVID